MKPRELSLNIAGKTHPIEYSDQGMNWVAERINFRLGRSNAKIVLVTDERVALHYLSLLKSALEDLELQVSVYSFPPGESEKTLRRVSDLLDRLAAKGFDKSDFVVGLGGGVVTDIAGFAASCYHRGMEWIACPTSLLGMIDAAIGGKTGVNHLLGKNLIGAIHPASAIIADVSALDTLSERELLSGSAEFVKHGLLHGGKLWDAVAEHGVDLNHWDMAVRNELIPECAQVKVHVVEQDLRESGLRMILNLGHTFGHAIESVTNYSLTHGEAVFLGMRAMLRLSERCGLLDAGEAIQIDKVLRSIKLPSVEMKADELLSYILHDKKSREGKLNWILLKGIGAPIITSDVNEQDVVETANWLCQAASFGTLFFELPRRLRVIVLNGPNLNLLGEREPEIYGHENLQEIEAVIREFADSERIEIMLQQSNSEGELVSLIQFARHWADGIVINAGAYTHTSVAIRDAISSISLPAVEVHLSKLETREEFRQRSMIRDVCIEQISGKGMQGYLDALLMIREHLMKASVVQ